MGSVMQSCVKGRVECDGCMECRGEVEEVRCPYCGSVADTLYKQEGQIIGCENCIEEVEA